MAPPIPKVIRSCRFLMATSGVSMARESYPHPVGHSLSSHVGHERPSRQEHGHTLAMLQGEFRTARAFLLCGVSMGWRDCWMQWWFAPAFAFTAIFIASWLIRLAWKRKYAALIGGAAVLV